MRAKLLVGLILVAGLIWAVKTVVTARRQAAEQNALALTKAQRASELAQQRTHQGTPVPAPTEILPPPSAEQVKPGVPAPVVEPPVPLGIKTQQVAKAKQPKTKPPLQDPDARDALSLVGIDPAAEVYWYFAINDPTIPVEERKDLIEDLNEHGLPDPKHPTADDLPVILRRIQIVEALGPQAMDEANAGAFDEAYKDLINLANIAAGAGGQPVK